VNKPLKAFHRHPTCSGDGHLGTCKDCISSYRKKYYSEHQEKARQNALVWNKNNRERKNSYLRIWKKKNREQVNLKNRIYYQQNPVKFRDKANKRRLIIKQTADGTVTMKTLEGLYSQQNYKCNECGTDISLKRDMDHIIPLSRGGLHTISNIQWLCVECSRRKGNKLPSEM
jgi:5-methylcytosine-specific restriction endonuclease McrA